MNDLKILTYRSRSVVRPECGGLETFLSIGFQKRSKRTNQRALMRSRPRHTTMTKRKTQATNSHPKFQTTPEHGT